MSNCETLEPQAEATFCLEIDPKFAGRRVDQTLAELLPDYSRATLQQWLRQGFIQIDAKLVKPKVRLRGGETVKISPPEIITVDCPAQPMDLDIIEQDADLIVLNKPVGLVVHPGAGNADNTLLNGLLHFDESLRALPRAGLVHRLDKDTSGLLVVARSEIARRRLIDQFQDRSMKRNYLAVVNGVLVSGETIAQPIGRHRQDRVRMCVTTNGKPAVTHIRVAQKFRRHCVLHVSLETGRTHQIRVHLNWRGFPIVGDKLYTKRVSLPPSANHELTNTLQQFSHQALHAMRLSLRHPISGEQKEWQQAPPADLAHLIAQLDLDHQHYLAQ